MTDKLLNKAAEFERRAETPTNLMTSDEFIFVATALRELVTLRNRASNIIEVHDHDINSRRRFPLHKYGES